MPRRQYGGSWPSTAIPALPTCGQRAQNASSRRADCDGTSNESDSGMRHIIVGMTGATGAVIGVELLRRLQQCSDVQTHVVLSRWARATIHLETELSARDVERLADVVYSWDDQAAAISSGSYRVEGMVVVPCSMKTLAAIRTGYADGLIARAADVTLKERRRLVLVPRETPLSEVHLDNMLALARMGASIVPPMPAFYNHPASIGDVVDHIVTRILDQFDIESPTARRWTGVSDQKAAGLKAVNI
jgi:flavin prenyltransferase